MNKAPSRRPCGFFVIILSAIFILPVIRQSRPERAAIRPVAHPVCETGATPHALPATDNQAPAPPAADVFTKSAPATFTGNAAQAELCGIGQDGSLGKAFAAARHAVDKIDPAGANSRGACYFAANPKQQLRAWLSTDGVELASGLPTPDDEEPWSIALRLRAVGRDGDLTNVAGGGATSAGSRVELKHTGAAITQWFENRTEGIEQGFTVTEVPAGNGLLEILMTVEGSTFPAAFSDPRHASSGIRFTKSNGDSVMEYTELKAWDRTGRSLEARMEVRGTQLALLVDDANAQYPVTIDPLFVSPEARLTGDSAIIDSYFGYSVAISGNVVIAGSRQEDTPAGVNAGAAYIFVRNGADWSLQSKIVASDGRSGDEFGATTALDGTYAVVGAPLADTAAGIDAGSAYVFAQSGGAWMEQANLPVADAGPGDNFGRSVAISGTTVVVGAARDDTAAGLDAGSAYVFLRSGTTWSHQTKIPSTAAGEEFGCSVSIDADTLVVGAHYSLVWTGNHAGSAYVYVRSGTIWSLQKRLTATIPYIEGEFGACVAINGQTVLIGSLGADRAYAYLRSGIKWTLQSEFAQDAEFFGRAVALDGDTAVIGADYADTAAGINAGSAFVYVRSGSTWTPQATLLPQDPSAFDLFGYAVAISGETIVVGAPYDDTSAGINAGSAYLFLRSGTTWTQQKKITSNATATTGILGYSLTFSGDTVVAGAALEDTAAGSDAGAAYVFVREESVWRQQAKLMVSDGAVGDHFGNAVALSGNLLVVGAVDDDTENGQDVGSVYVFARAGTHWTEVQKLSGGAASEQFGNALAVDGSTVIIGAPHVNMSLPTPDETNLELLVGCVYVYVWNGTALTLQQTLLPDELRGEAFYGYSVAISGDTVLVGAPYADTAFAASAGAGYVFLHDGTTWSEQAALTATDGKIFDFFGGAVALDADISLIGASQDDTIAGVDSGSAYVFVRNASLWTQQAKLSPIASSAEDYFGVSVALSGGTAVVGAPSTNTATGQDVGNVSVFQKDGTRWNLQATLSAGLTAASTSFFGGAVAIQGDTVIVGAPGEDSAAGEASGAIYVFRIGELPVITGQPTSRTVIPMVPVTFHITATGYAPLRYQWRKDGLDIAGAHDASYTIPSAQVTDQGNYDCVVSNIGGVTTSAAATLTVNALSQFAQSFPTVPPDALGYVFVNLTPYGIGGWRFAGEQQWRSSGVPVGGLATADRVIEFRPVPGYLQPPAETVGVVSGGAATVVEQVYYETPVSGSGSITVTLKPEALADAGVPQAQRAQWRLLGEDDSHWRDSNATLGGLVPGDYLIECKPVAGRSTPPPGDVWVQDGQTALTTLTYFLADAVAGTAPGVLPFETVATSPGMPYAYVGQIRSDVGVSTGFVVKARVVATAGHVVFDDARLASATGLEWLFQRDRGSNEPKPQVPRGFYLFNSYAAQRAAEHTPGTSTPLSQNLDAAAMYFLEDAGRGGFGGYLASDADDSEFLLSVANKTLVGYPVDGIVALYQGRMHATPTIVAFTRAYGHTYTTSAIRSSGGASGGPLCVQFEGGSYYPAAIYLGGSGQTVVRSIDSSVIELFRRAEVSGNGGDNNTGGGITHTSVMSLGSTTLPGVLKVTIEPAAARNAGAGWRLKPETSYRLSEAQKTGLNPGSYILQLTTLNGFQAPAQQTVLVNGGQLHELTFTYLPDLTPMEIWRMANFGTTSNTGTAADGTDPDHDGQTNLSEFAAGTDPNNGADFFRILTTTRTSTSYTVTAAGKAEHSYVLERAATLISGTWTTANTTGPLAADGTVTLTDTSPPANRGFYRLRVTVP